MAKTFKLTEAQLKMLHEYMINNKPVSDFAQPEESPAAQAYYRQNPEAAAAAQADQEASMEEDAPSKDLVKPEPETPEPTPTVPAQIAPETTDKAVLGETGTGEFTYSTPVKDVNVYHYDLSAAIFGLPEGSQIDNIRGHVEVEWSLEIDARNWGVKALDISVHRVHGTLVVEYYPSHDMDASTEEHSVEFDAQQYGLEISQEIEIRSQIVPSIVEIDFQRKELKIS